MQEMAPRFLKFSGGGGGGGVSPDPPSKLPRCARSCSAENHTPIHFETWQACEIWHVWHYQLSHSLNSLFSLWIQSFV